MLINNNTAAIIKLPVVIIEYTIAYIPKAKIRKNNI